MRIVMRLFGLVLSVSLYAYITDELPLGAYGALGGASHLIERIISYCFLLFGVAGGAICRELIQRRSKGQRRVKILSVGKGIFRSIDFWIGVCGSPLIFAGVLSNTSEMTLEGLCMVAIENGFTCTIVVSTLLNTDAREATANTPSPDGH